MRLRYVDGISPSFYVYFCVQCEQMPQINASVADTLLDMQPSTSHHQDDVSKSGCLDILPATWRDRLDLAASMVNCFVSPRVRRRPVPAQGSTGEELRI